MFFFVMGNIDDVDHTFAGESQEEGMMQQSSSFLDYKTKVIEAVGLGEG